MAVVSSSGCSIQRRISRAPIAVTVSSSQGLENLFAVLDHEMLRSTPLFVPHARIAERARALAVREVVLAGHSDDEIVERLVAYFGSHG